MTHLSGPDCGFKGTHTHTHTHTHTRTHAHTHALIHTSMYIQDMTVAIRSLHTHTSRALCEAYRLTIAAHSSLTQPDREREREREREKRERERERETVGI